MELNYITVMKKPCLLRKYFILVILFFFFDNITSDSFYLTDALYVKDINNGIANKQLQLRNRWYDFNRVYIVQPINF